METSIVENKKNTSYIPNNFKIGKNIPIDCRFLISSLTELNTEIPLKVRYPGLIFFVSDAKLNNGTDDILTGLLYCFESDLSTPIPLHNIYERINVSQVTYVTNNYSTLLTELNKCFPKPGKIVYVKPLNVAFVYDGTVWKYFAGEYYLSAENIFNTIPQSLLEPGKTVKIGTSVYKKISIDKLLVNFAETVTNVLPEVGINGNYYVLNGFLYFFIEDQYFNISNKSISKTLTVSTGINQILHPLDSIYIFAYYRINSTTNVLVNSNNLSKLEINTIDNGTIEFYSNFDDLEIELILIADNPISIN